MSLPFFHKDHIDISNQLDFPGELLNLSACSENSILIIGPELVRREALPSQGHTHTYLEHLLKGMVVWCTQNKVIQDQDIIHDLHVLLHNGALVPLAYTIEEYLAAPQLKEQCLRAVLNPYSQAETIHYRLTRLPFRGYIITSYDTCIETAYEETQHAQLSKFYQSSLTQAVEASQKKQPFILKLYGDLAEPDSIKLGHRLLTGLYAGDVRQQLRQLFCETPRIFIGFDDADQDLIALQSLIIDEYNDLQKHSAHSGEQHDGITTKPDDQSSLDSATYEIFPGYFLAEPLTSFQSQDIASKDERFKKEAVPDATERETIEIPASDVKYRSNGIYSDSTPPPADSTSDSDNENGPRLDQAMKPTAENSQPATAPTGEAQVLDFHSLVESDDLQLPNTGILNDFKQFLKNKCNDIDIQVGNEPGVSSHSGRPVKYTEVTRGQQGNKDVRALIYIPGSIMSKRDPLARAVILSLCSEFPSETTLIVCTDTETCDIDIEEAVNVQQNRKVVSLKIIKRFLECKEKTEKVFWINRILNKNL